MLGSLLMQQVEPQTSQPNHQTLQNDKLSESHKDIRIAQSVDDYERGALSDQVVPANSSTRVYIRLLWLAGLFGVALLVQLVWSAKVPHSYHHGWWGETVLSLDDLCPQVAAFTSPKYEALLRSLDEEFDSTEFRLKAYELLGGAVRIPTESYDDLGSPSEDPRWEIMGEFHEYLESRFPKVHQYLKRTKVNTYALVYEWKGTENVKPVLLAAHMDVVPVNPDTYEDWIQPPYSGYYDGEWIWGRGSCDDKSALIGILTAIETLLEFGFVPSRTVLLAFGIDEESGGGRNGAGAINEYLLETYGPDSMAMLIDEAGGFSVLNDTVFAKPGVSERGVIDIRVDVSTPGGHSSRPPKHTGIGILADLITELENQPHHPELIRGRTYYQLLECRAKYDTSFPSSLTKLLLDSETSDEKLRELGDRLVDFDPLYYALSGSTQAFDLIGGGVKVNALPEAVWAVANNRIAAHSSTTELIDRFTRITHTVAAKHNMTLEAFGETVGSQGPSWGTIRLDVFNGNSLAPAPVTPTTGSGPYELLSGTVLSTLETHLRKDDFPKSAIVAPSLSTGNTDTRHYWDLTQHIFRYNHQGSDDVYGEIHTVNEAIRAEGFLEEIRFFTRLIVNADQTDLLE